MVRHTDPLKNDAGTRTVTVRRGLRLSARLLVLVGVLIGGLSLSINANMAYLTLPVTFNNTLLPMESQLVRMDDVLYMPLREWIKALKGQMTYLPKDDAYEIKVSGNAAIVIAAYSPEIWVSGRQHFMQHPAIYIDRQIYVPLEEFAWILGAKAEITTKGVTLNFAGLRAPSSSSAGTKRATVLATREETKFVLDTFQFPNLRNVSNPILEIAGQRFPIKGLYLYQKDTLYLNFGPIFESLGGKISMTDKTVQVAIFGKTLHFSRDSQVVKIQQDPQEETRYMADALHVRNNVTLISLQAIAAALGLQPHWTPHQQTLTLASRLRVISLQQRDNSLALVIRTSLPIAPVVPTASKSVPRFEIEFPSTVLGFSPGELLSPMGPLAALRWRQDGSTSYLMLMYEEEGSILKPIQQGDQWVIAFQNKLTKLTQITHEGYPALEISAEYPFGLRLWRPDANRLVMDMPDVTNTLPLTVSANAENPYTKIRTSQFSWTPLSSRIVVDLKDQTGYILVKKDAQTWRVVFGKKGEKMPPQLTIPTVKKTPDTPTKTILSSMPSSSQSPLKNKIIFIDPGHGGDDPGALGPSDEYEKEFTLDISLRLGKILLSQGARVVYARTDDQNPSLQTRVEMAEKVKASLFVSVHINSFFHSYANGTETYYFKPEDKALADAMHPEIMKVTQGKNNGLKRARLYVLRNTTMPAVLVEPLFLTHKAELEKLKTTAFRQNIAHSLADGILRYYAK